MMSASDPDPCQRASLKGCIELNLDYFVTDENIEATDQAMFTGRQAKGTHGKSETKPSKTVAQISCN